MQDPIVTEAYARDEMQTMQLELKAANAKNEQLTAELNQANQILQNYQAILANGKLLELGSDANGNPQWGYLLAPIPTHP